eukprot:scaffold5603_cov45-Prasinocladus_malaysianus.AAC.2
MLLTSGISCGCRCTVVFTQQVDDGTAWHASKDEAGKGGKQVAAGTTQEEHSAIDDMENIVGVGGKQESGFDRAEAEMDDDGVEGEAEEGEGGEAGLADADADPIAAESEESDPEGRENDIDADGEDPDEGEMDEKADDGEDGAAEGGEDEEGGTVDEELLGVEDTVMLPQTVDEDADSLSVAGGKQGSKSTALSSLLALHTEIQQDKPDVLSKLLKRQQELQVDRFQHGDEEGEGEDTDGEFRQKDERDGFQDEEAEGAEVDDTNEGGEQGEAEDGEDLEEAEEGTDTEGEREVDASKNAAVNTRNKPKKTVGEADEYMPGQAQSRKGHKPRKLACSGRGKQDPENSGACTCAALYAGPECGRIKTVPGLKGLANFDDSIDLLDKYMSFLKADSRENMIPLTVKTPTESTVVMELTAGLQAQLSQLVPQVDGVRGTFHDSCALVGAIKPPPPAGLSAL